MTAVSYNRSRCPSAAVTDAAAAAAAAADTDRRILCFTAIVSSGVHRFVRLD